MRRRFTLLAVALVVPVAACGAGDPEPTSASVPAAERKAAQEPEPRSAAERTPATGARSAAKVRLRTIGRFDQPIYLTSPPADRNRQFVVERKGTIRVVRRGRKLAQPFLDITDKVRTDGEYGLLSMAFAPDYARSRRYYVFYSDTGGNTRVVEYRASRTNADRTAPGSARQILFLEDEESNHNGGLLKFGPDDLLYIAIGDGGGAGDQHGTRGNGQDLGTLFGKILRIDPRRGEPYAIPRSNPFVGRRGARGEIYAYGLRNPWRFSFDRRTGDMIIADVGEKKFEEVDFARRGRGRGANWGWRPFEGFSRFAPGERAPGARKPAFVYGRDRGCSIIGGYVVRDRSLGALYGKYVYGDLCQPALRTATLGRGKVRQNSVGVEVDTLLSFGEDARGRVYALSGSGPVYRLVRR